MYIIILAYLPAIYIGLRLYYLHTIVRQWEQMKIIYIQHKRDNAEEPDLSALTKINLEYSKLFDPRYWFMPVLLTIQGNEKLFYFICYINSLPAIQSKPLNQQQHANTKSDGTATPTQAVKQTA